MSLLLLNVSKSFQLLLCACVILSLTTKSPHCASQILPLPFTNLSPFGVIFLCWLPNLVKDQQISQNGPVQRRSNHLSCLFFSPLCSGNQGTKYMGQPHRCRRCRCRSCWCCRCQPSQLSRPSQVSHYCKHYCKLYCKHYCRLYCKHCFKHYCKHYCRLYC